MKAPPRLRTLVTAAIMLALGCQSIAGVEDVSYGEQSSSECASYCSTLGQACPGDVAVYDDDETCNAVCPLFKPGTTAKPQGNTLACRSAQAETAFKLMDDLGENRSNCAAAGPGGGDGCTSQQATPDCEGYCTVYMAACTSTSMKWGFSTFEQCTARCAAFPNDGSYTAKQGESGDSMACRLRHATLAVVDPDNNCESAGLLPSGACAGAGVPSCDDYCRANKVACANEYASYESIRQCQAVCSATVKGDRADSGGQDTVGCRLYHSYFALKGEPTPHCSHSGPVGDGVCTDDMEKHPNCIAFCRLLNAGCPDDFEQAYSGDAAACIDDCETLEDAGGNQYSITKAQSGNTLKCRTLHVARAVTDPDSADAPRYCAAAMGEPPCN